MTTIRSLLAGAALAIGATLALAGPGSAAPVGVPFQIAPAPYGNPGGSIDSLPTHCVVVVGERPGVATVAGGQNDGWGCTLNTPIRWINLSTGASGVAVTSDGLNGFPPRAEIATGPGQIAMMITPGGVYTPGFATVAVP